MKSFERGQALKYNGEHCVYIKSGKLPGVVMVEFTNRLRAWVEINQVTVVPAK